MQVTANVPERVKILPSHDVRFNSAVVLPVNAQRLPRAANRRTVTRWCLKARATHRHGPDDAEPRYCLLWVLRTGYACPRRRAVLAPSLRSLLAGTERSRPQRPHPAYAGRTRHHVGPRSRWVIVVPVGRAETYAAFRRRFGRSP
jgi:hypothetical protein